MRSEGITLLTAGRGPLFIKLVTFIVASCIAEMPPKSAWAMMND